MDFIRLRSIKSTTLTLHIKLLHKTSLKECRDGMAKIFGLQTSPLQCIRIAIKTLKLGFVDMDDDAKNYYRTFDNAVITNGIQIPDEYCKRKTGNLGPRKKEEFTKCMRELVNFEELNVFGIDVESERDQESIQDYARYIDKCMTDLRDFGIDIDSKGTKETILVGALYLHKQTKNEFKRHHHLIKSYGSRYLNHISKVIQLKDANMKDPNQYCDEKYNNPTDSLSLV